MSKNNKPTGLTKQESKRVKNDSQNKSNQIYNSKKSAEQTKTEVVEIVGANIPNQIAGHWYPDSSVKKGTRWFYVVQLIFALMWVILVIFVVIMFCWP